MLCIMNVSPLTSCARWKSLSLIYLVRACSCGHDTSYLTLSLAALASPETAVRFCLSLNIKYGKPLPFDLAFVCL